MDGDKINKIYNLYVYLGLIRSRPDFFTFHPGTQNNALSIEDY